MELEMNQKLKLFAVTITSKDQENLPADCKFILGYSLDDVQHAILDRFGGTEKLIATCHGNISIEAIMTKANVKLEKGSELPKVLPIIQQIEQVQEMKKDTFFQGLMLIADKFVDEKDSKILKQVLKRAKIKTEKTPK